mgnify:CR=1 FL=1
MENKKITVAAVILSIGLILGGVLTGYYYYKAHFGANFVTVKGLAEKPVKADLAVWELKFVQTGDDAVVLQQKMASQQQTITEHLKTLGFEEGEINIGRLDTNDLTANPYNTNTNIHFILSQTITVKSNKVDLVASSIGKMGALIEKGIIFDSQSYSSPVNYLFTKLNDIKPQMLSQATKNAKLAAEEFAKNSGAKVGKIHTAHQGIFSILPSEEIPYLQETQQINKKVRVVSTITYYLE